MKCWICDSSTTIKLVKTRDGKRRIIRFCPKCDFYFFSKGAPHLITHNKFEEARLKTACLNIPDLKIDFKNGIDQSCDYIKKYIKKSDYSKNILEIGCSWGYFLKLLKDRGIKAVGLEINPVRVNYVEKDLGVPCYKSLKDIEKDKLTFHKIFIFYVIQYIPKPVEYFNRLFKLLQKGGTVYIITPNLNDILLSVWQNKDYANFFFEKMTVAYYSVEAIRRLMSVLKHNYSISYHLKTEQGYSFFNHLNWYFIRKPRTTGIVGGDKFVLDVSKKISSSNRKLGRELSDLINRFDCKYRSLIEKYDLGNRIILKVKKVL
jgi:2-polyprenyl-3-methyl-5-hydroxy-6-metoxy-1,4-benzoquinol methylase